MSVHVNDSALLSRMIRVAEAIIARPQTAFAFVPDLVEIEGDLVAAIRCPAVGSKIGKAETILHAALAHLATARLSQVEVYRFAFLAQHALPMVRDHLFALVVSQQSRVA